jgi:hypothetical protein
MGDNLCQSSQLQAQSIANQYQSNLVAQQQKQFEFQMSQQQALAPSALAAQKSALAVQTHFNTAASKAAVSCPGNASVRTSPDGQLYCRQKTSGGFLGIPVGDVFRTIQGLVSGAESVAPTIGAQAAQSAAAYYTGKAFPSAVQRPQVASTPGIVPGPPQLTMPNMSSFGYGEHIG